jgi:hypothetical protein
VTRSDEDLAEQAVKFGHQHEFADLAWYPGHRKVLYRKDDRLPVNVSGNGVYNFIGFRSTATLAIEINRFSGTKNIKVVYTTCFIETKSNIGIVHTYIYLIKVQINNNFSIQKEFLFQTCYFDKHIFNGSCYVKEFSFESHSNLDECILMQRTPWRQLEVLMGSVRIHYS